MSETLVELRAAKLRGWGGVVADHYWLLVLRGVIGKRYETCDRWEVWQHADQNETCWGHLHKNLLDPCQGCGNGPSKSIQIWRDSDAVELIQRLESAPSQYPYKAFYRYWPGPNSNTFAQWVVRRKLRLGIRAVGRFYPLPRGSKK